MSSFTELQPSPRLFLNGLLSCGVHCQAGWKEADVLQREFPSVCPQGTLTAITLICQDTCPWRGSHLLCESHSLLWAVLDILFCLTIPVIEIIKWGEKVGSLMWKYGGKGIPARPSPFGTWPINSSFSGSLSVLALRSSLWAVNSTCAVGGCWRALPSVH